MSGHDIVVIGASAGGVEALMQIVKDLPGDLNAAVFVVLPISPNAASALPSILRRVGQLPTSHAIDGESIQAGQIYIAPPDYHLLIERVYIRVTHDPQENNHRPAVDPLFRTAARAYGSQVIGVILSGAMDDGAAGLWAVKARNGLTVVQDPEDAPYSGMPRSAIENVDVDFIVPLSDIAALVARLVKTPTPEDLTMPDTMNRAAGIPSEYACPNCGGTLWELKDGELVRYQCRTGHAFSPESLLAAAPGNKNQQ